MFAKRNVKMAEHVDYCKLCERLKRLTFHHLIPVTLHKNKWFKKHFDKMDMHTRGLMLCKDCHDYIHDTFKPKKLGRYLNTEEKLRNNKLMAKFIAFVKKKK
jgi:hypothetical protein